jgi:hypothetical protein
MSIRLEDEHGEVQAQIDDAFARRVTLLAAHVTLWPRT